LRSNVEKTVGDISCDYCGGARAVGNADGEARNVAADDLRKKQRSKKAAGVALRANGEIQFCARGIDDRVPLGDASRQGNKVDQQDGDKPREWNARKRGPQRRDGKKMQ
jgi:hypothetical protein